MKTCRTVRLSPLIFGGICSLLLLSGNARAQTPLFKLESVKGDYIGQGKTIEITNAVAIRLKGTLGAVDVSLDTAGGYDVHLQPVRGGRLAVGIYTNAIQSPDSLSPALMISGDGRACNKACGSFQIHEIHANAKGDVDRLWVTFTNSCECAMPPLTGEVYVNNQPAETVAPPADTSGLPKLKGIFYKSVNAKAMIGDDMVKVGDVVDGYKILKINRDSVEVTTPTGETKVLTPK